MAILRKNIRSPDQNNGNQTSSTTPPRTTRSALRALFSTSPTSFSAINPISIQPSSLLAGVQSSTVITNANRFHPKLIFAQIVALQSIHYLVLSILFQISHSITGASITIDRIFTANYLQLWTKEGWIDNTAILISSVVGAVLLALIVEKSKKCLDFSITLFSVHFVICTLYGGFPASWDWWIIHIVGLIVMVLLGEYFCSRVELRDIPLL